MREQERQKQTLLKVRAHISAQNMLFMTAHISRAYAANVASLSYIMHMISCSDLLEGNVFQT